MQCHMIPEWYCVAIVVILSDQRSEYRKTGLAGILWLLSCMLHHGVNPLELTSWIFPFAQKLGGGALSGGGHWTLSAADWRSGLVIAGIMLCSTAALVIGGRVIYLWGLPVGGGWALCWGLEPPLVVGGGVIGDSLTAPLDLGPNWKTNCGLHTYREPKGAARNRLYEGTLCFHPKFDLT